MGVLPVAPVEMCTTSSTRPPRTTSRYWRPCSPRRVFRRSGRAARGRGRARARPRVRCDLSTEAVHLLEREHRFVRVEPVERVDARQRVGGVRASAARARARPRRVSRARAAAHGRYRQRPGRGEASRRATSRLRIRNVRRARVESPTRAEPCRPARRSPSDRDALDLQRDRRVDPRLEPERLPHDARADDARDEAWPDREHDEGRRELADTASYVAGPSTRARKTNVPSAPLVAVPTGVPSREMVTGAPTSAGTIRPFGASVSP